MAIKHDEESYKIYIRAQYLAERAHTVAILTGHGQDVEYDKERLIQYYKELSESLCKAGWI